jgi:hypothetical protein
MGSTNQQYLVRIVRALSNAAGGAYAPKRDDSINGLLTKWAKLLGVL